jgi:phosphoglycolate phosphatase
MKIIFDLDGTLFQTQYCDINAVNRLFDELGLIRPNENDITHGIGKKTGDFLRGLLPTEIELNMNKVRQRFRELEQQEVHENGILFPYVYTMLNQLVLNGHSLYICSNGSLEYIELVLQRTKIGEFFCEIHSAKEYDSKADAVNSIIGKEKRAVVIGDTNSDIEAANRNKIPSIAVTYGYGYKDDLRKATFIAENAMEIIDYVIQIEVFYHIKHQLIDRGRRIIGINGVDTSGKTVFTGKYSRFLESIGLKNIVLHIDDFHNPSQIRYQGENEIDAYYNNAFNYKQVIDEILEPLQKAGYLDKEVLCLDLDTDTYEKLIHFQIDKNTILLIEGVLLFREPLLSFLEGKVFLNISFEEVMNRALLRDVPKYGETFLQKYSKKYIPIQKRYLLEHNPEQNSDIVIDNEDFLKPRIVK